MVAMIHCTLPYYWTNEPHMDWDKYQHELEMKRLRAQLEGNKYDKADMARDWEKDNEWDD